MSKYLSILLLGMISLVATGTSFAVEETLRLTGLEGGKQPAFKVDSPWLLDWRTNSDSPLIAYFELQLYDVESGEFLGTVAELMGTGRGLKLFEDAGTYQLDIIAGNVNWNIGITEVSQNVAENMINAKDAKPSLKESSQRMIHRVPESSFVSWRAIDDRTLLLFDDGGIGWRVIFLPECPGLASVTAISFVAPLINDDNQYDSVLLDDGTRCYFDQVRPMSGDRPVDSE